MTNNSSFINLHFCYISQLVNAKMNIIDLKLEKDYRKRGIGTALVKHVLDVAKKAGYADLHLFTPNQEYFYKSLGWSTISQEQYRGEQVTVMKYSLQNHRLS